MPMAIDVTEYDEELEVDAQGKVVYHGFSHARPGIDALKSSAVWKIVKYNYTGNFLTGKRWADGESKTFDKTWSLRTAYTYI